ncbi:MAG: tRNA (guanosine(37)-N1)-methyltransferase TrmD [Parcubacteria group bacterium]|nr:tRNA (guanosine(37)-N1)-methyltransferase TrmD [Parcubacteria group bacterium]
MITFHIITIFPEALEGYCNASILKRAQVKKRIKIILHNLRDFSKDNHKSVDDRPFGGGPGMVLMVDLLVGALKHILKKDFKLDAGGKLVVDSTKYRIVLFDTRGEPFTQEIARSFLPNPISHKLKAKSSHIILICGHYEGVDERIKEFCTTDVISIGNYVLSGGEVPAMVVVDAVTRLIPGVLGNEESIEETRVVKGYAVYTRPRDYSPKRNIVWKVPDPLFSGDPKKIDEWRREH